MKYAIDVLKGTLKIRRITNIAIDQFDGGVEIGRPPAIRAVNVLAEIVESTNSVSVRKQFVSQV